ENLPMSGVVAEEGDLRHEQREHDGRAQLPPRVPDDDERDDEPRAERGEADELGPVVAVGAPEQAGLLDLAGERREGADLAFAGRLLVGTGAAGGGGRRHAFGPSL